MGIKVLIVDDQAVVRTGFRYMVDTQPDLEVVGEAADGRSAVEEVRRLRPDVVLMDIRMPRLNGLDATRQILTDPATADSRVLMVTTFEQDDYVYEALRAGASGFLLKDISPAGLVDAVRTVHAGHALLAPSVTRRLIGEFSRLHRPTARRRHPGLDQLTTRERDVLVLVAGGLSNSDIADRLFLGESTVKTHVSRLLAKLALRDRTQLVVLAYEAGVVRPGTDDE